MRKSPAVLSFSTVLSRRAIAIPAITTPGRFCYIIYDYIPKNDLNKSSNAVWGNEKLL